MTDSINNGIPFVPENTIDQAAAFNESIKVIDRLLQLKVLAMKQNTPAASPVVGNRYIVGTSPTGAWAGHALEVAEWVEGGFWEFSKASATVFGTSIYLNTGSDWVPASAGGGAAWGGITGSIADQEDLQDEFALREFILTAGSNITIDRTDPEAPVISATGGGGGSSEWGDIGGDIEDQTDLIDLLDEKEFALVAGTNITIDRTNPKAPVISASGGGGGGQVDSIAAGEGITVDNTDPENPEVSVDFSVAEYKLTAGTGISIDRTDPDAPVISATGGGGGMTNPMTTAGDLIKGGTSGAPVRLGIGTSGQLLSVVSGSPAWVDPPSGAGDVVGPASATDDAIALFNGTTGKLLQDSAVLLSALERTLTAGSNITIDRTNPDAPVISSTASGTGDVVGPASAVNNGVALFDGATGKLIKDGGVLGTAAFSDTGDFATAAQGALADSALQADDIGVSVQAQLVSGTNIKTVNSQSLLGSGNLSVTAAAPTVQSLTSSRNLVLADSNTVNVNSSSSAYTATIQAQADQTWVADTEIHFLKTGTGNIVITAASGVTLNGTSAGSVTISQQYGAATIKRISENVWVAVGVLAENQLPITKQYISSPTSYALAGLLSFSHGLGSIPKITTVRMLCVTSDLGYSPGDYYDGPFGGALCTVIPSSTSLDVRINSAASIFINKSSGVGAAHTPANWNIIVSAWV